MQERNRRGTRLPTPTGGWPQTVQGDANQLDALARLVLETRVGSDSSTAIRSHADARAAVLTISFDLLTNLRSSADSPTFADADELLKEIHDLAVKLDRKLARVSGPRGITQIVARECGFFRKAAASGGTETQVGWAEILSRPLRTLASAAEQYQMAIAGHRGAGKQRLHDRLFHEPRRVLARDCALVLAGRNYNSSGPYPTESKIRALMEAVWRFATGETPDSGVLDEAARQGAADARAGNFHSPYDPLLRGLIAPKN